MKVKQTSLPEVLEIEPFIARDRRGSFVKIFHAAQFADHGLESSFPEEFYNVSCRRTLRGLHFQLPPHELAKIVCCVHGAIRDVVLDLRRGSPTYGKHAVFELNARAPRLIYIPPGLANGFYVSSDQAVVLYKVSKVHAQSHDSGLLWSSAGIAWGDDDPILSDRDRAFEPLGDFHSPFTFHGDLPHGC